MARKLKSVKVAPVSKRIKLSVTLPADVASLAGAYASYRRVDLCVVVAEALQAHLAASGFVAYTRTVPGVALEVPEERPTIVQDVPGLRLA